MIDIRQIRCFLAVAESNSFTRAAEQMGLAQPALSYQVLRLEQELQVKLFVRARRGIELTEAGRYLRQAGHGIVDDLNRAHQHLLEMSGAPRGNLKIGITPTVSEYLIVPLVQRLEDAFPSVKLVIVEEISSVLAEWVQSRRIDIAVAYDIVPVRGLQVRTLIRDQLCLVDAAKGRSGKATTVAFSELSEVPLIVRARPHRIRERVEAIAKKNKQTLNVLYEVQSVRSGLQLAENGFGGALLSGAIARYNTKPKILRTRTVVDPGMEFELSVIYPSGEPLSQIQTNAVAIISELIQERRG